MNRLHASVLFLFKQFLHQRFDFGGFNRRFEADNDALGSLRSIGLNSRCLAKYFF